MKLLPIFSSPEPEKTPEILPPEAVQPNPQSAASSGSEQQQPDDDFTRAAAHVISENGGAAASPQGDQSQPVGTGASGEVLPPADYFRKKAAALIPKPFRMMAIAFDAPTLELEDKIVQLLADDGGLALEELWPIIGKLFGDVQYKHCMMFGAMFAFLTGDKLLEAWKLFREKQKADKTEVKPQNVAT